MSGKRIVVGVDGSEPSKAALDWAVGQARLTGLPIDAVISWEYPLSDPTVWVPEAFNGVEAAALTTLTNAVAEVLGDESTVQLTTRVVRGRAASVLLDAVTSDDLLVVGSRGRGGFTGLLLGSVSAQCAQHAPCPLVIVRAPA